jgi:hypothetical protein
MELSKEQIDQLFKFTEKKYVRWYDLQVEIVDHLATKIEELMTNNPSLSFESALQRVYTGFGIFGFAKVVQQKELALAQASRTLWWKSIGEFFTWPKIAFTAFVFSSSWQLAQMFDTAILEILFIVIYIITAVVLLKKELQMKRSTKKLLLLQQGSYSSTFVMIYQFSIINVNGNLSPTAFAILVVAGTLFHIAWFNLYSSISKKAKELYPEAFVQAA